MVDLLAGGEDSSDYCLVSARLMMRSGSRERPISIESLTSSIEFDHSTLPLQCIFWPEIKPVVVSRASVDSSDRQLALPYKTSSLFSSPESPNPSLLSNTQHVRALFHLDRKSRPKERRRIGVDYECGIAGSDWPLGMYHVHTTSSAPRGRWRSI